ncbi:TolC family protein [Stakelama marina]|uniref:TolC family protein n=1 Tax=Stakelama marina TaxID=2826939 RepID=A0A8T4IHT0_9SPHN|nr:TolC family protein [Stakelama marina]MBR0551849.1 TolC family protein [Stakelama marina]
MKSALLLVTSFFALATTAVAQERPDLPPAPVVARVLDTHPMVEAAAADVSAARADARMLRKGPHEVTVSGSYIRRSVDREGGFDEFDGTVARAFRLPGKARLDRKAGALGIEEADNNREDARHQTSLMLMNAWHDWLLAGALLRNDRAAVANYERLLAAVERRVELRDAARLDAEQARSELALAKTRLANSAADMRAARAKLHATFPDLPLPEDPPAPATPELPDTALGRLRDLVIERSHEIRAAEFRADRYDVLGRRARRDRVADPSVGVRLFSERSGAERGAGMVFSMPLGGGYRSAAADKAEAEASRARLELTNTRREVIATADADLSNATDRFAAWQASAAAVEGADSAADLSERGYKGGVTDLSDLLYVDRQALAARREEITARVAALRAIMKLRVDSHDMWAPDEG